MRGQWGQGACPGRTLAAVKQDTLGPAHGSRPSTALDVPMRNVLGDSQVPHTVLPLFWKEILGTGNLDLWSELPRLLLFVNPGKQLLKYPFRLVGSHVNGSQSWGKCNAFNSSQPSPFPLLSNSGTELSSFLPSSWGERKQFLPTTACTGRDLGGLLVSCLPFAP